MASELVVLAFEDNRVRGIVGNTARGNAASCEVFRHLGFVEAEPGPDPDAVRFVLARQSRGWTKLQNQCRPLPQDSRPRGQLRIEMTREGVTLLSCCGF